MLLHHKHSLLAACFLFFTVMAAFAAGRTGAIIRYGLIIGANQGGPDREDLQYAAKDAESFAQVMQEMGGLLPGNSIILLNPDIMRIEHSFAAVKRLIVNQNKGDVRQEFIFYYSGHSDEEGLLIGTQKLSYKHLRSLIATVPGDVRIAVIDSCASGIFIRTKGGVKRAPFMVDSSTEMKGYAFLTSSSETEAAQESDAIKASFFTHYLVSGLRGAADVTQDGVVTLNEAYHYTFTETLARTEKTQHGPQHPSYDIQLTGTGDLVLTDLREVTASLIIEEDVLGRIYIRNVKGDLVVELNKTAQPPMEVGLSPGTYQITVDNNATYYQAQVSLSEGRKTSLQASNLKKMRSESTYARGENEATIGLDGEYSYDYMPVSFSLIPGFPDYEKENTLTRTTLSLNLTLGVDDIIEGCALSVVGSTVLYDMRGAQVSGVYNIDWGETQGASLSGIFNLAYGNTGYLQMAGVFNHAMGRMDGVQIGGVYNYSAMSVNGVQLAGACNIAQDVSGAQVSVGLNLGKRISGAQVGLINISEKVDGVQVGLINIADENNGVAVGLFNYSKNGILNFELWQEMEYMTCMGFKFGTKNFYTIFLAGYDTFFDSQRWELGLGWGLHLPVENLFIDIDALCASVQDPRRNDSTPFMKTLLPQMRLKIGYTFFSTLGVFAGVNLQMFHPDLYYNETDVRHPLFVIPEPHTGAEIAFVPRVFFGIQLLK
jgi:hypothetical protein